jgi:hypothetical protein
MSKNYFEIVYQGPFKGIHSTLPEDLIPIDHSPFMQNFILKDGEIRTRPFQGNYMPGPPDKNTILGVQSFTDQNNVIHTVCVTASGLWQLNRNWPNQPTKVWQSVGKFLTQPGPNFPISSQIFVNKFFWTNGGPHLWMWDGVSGNGVARSWAKKTNFLQGTLIQDPNGNCQHANNSGTTGSVVPAWSATLGGSTTDGTIKWTQNGKYVPANGFIDSCIVDATNGLTAGGYFLIELNAQLLLLNTIETQGNFSQRIRWCPSGLPGIWDPNVNIGAGFNDELDVPDIISGAFTVGSTAFVLRINGITEITSNAGSGTNPFSFNHLWASKKGIGNILPFGFASYGPLGIFISSDDIYSVSMGGFKRIGDKVKNRLFNDIGQATAAPMASIVPYYASNYIYNHYKLAIPTGNDTKIWNYCIEEDSWQFEINYNALYSGQTNWVYVG